MKTRIPLSFARSALFAPMQRVGELPDKLTMPAASYSNWAVSMKYTGPELTPAHAMVWQTVVGLAVKPNDEMCVVEVSARDFLAHLGRKLAKGADTTSKRWLLDLLAELKSAHVEVTTPNHCYTGPLLAVAEVIPHKKKEPGDREKAKPRGMLRLALPPEILPLLTNEYARVRLEDKHGLAQHPMAAWLYDWCATLKAGFSIPLAELQKMCGSPATVGTFGRTLKAALDVLVERKAIEGYTIERGVLKLSKAPGKVVLLSGTKQANVQRRTSFRTAAQQFNTRRAGISGNL